MADASSRPSADGDVGWRRRAVPTGGPVGRVRGNVGIGLADAAVASLNNLGVSVLVARSSSVRDFGVFATAMLVLLLSTVAMRSAHGDPLVLVARAEDGAAVTPEARASSRSVLRLGLLVGTAVGCCGAVGLVATDGRSDLALVLLACGVGIPLLWLQDHLRWVEYARGASAQALVSNVLWTATSLTALAGTVAATGADLTAPLCVALWSVSTLPAIAHALRRAPMAARGRSTASWLRPRARLVRRLVLDFTLTQATAQGATVVIAALVGAVEMALIRKGQIWLGPLTVVTTGMLSAMQPVLVQRTRARGSTATVRVAYAMGLAGGALCFVYGALVLLVPTAQAELLVGEGWQRARPFVLPMTVMAATGLLGGCLGLALRTTGRLSRQVRWRAVLAPGSIVLIATTTWFHGSLAGMWSVALASTLTTGAWALLLTREGDAAHA